MEAELFAAQIKLPAPSGRALLCAANYARKIQGITASQKRTDARNRAPVTPVSLHISDVSAQRKVRGVKRGQETIWCPVPFFLRRQTAAIPLSVGTDTPGPPKAAKNALDGAYPRLLHQRCRNRRNREPVLPDRRKHACARQKNPSDKTKSIDFESVLLFCPKG